MIVLDMQAGNLGYTLIWQILTKGLTVRLTNIIASVNLSENEYPQKIMLLI